MSEVGIKMRAGAGDSVEIEPLRYLGSKFGAYRDACASSGARYMGGNKSALPLAQVPALLASLQAAGVEPAVDRAIVDALRSEATEMSRLASEGQARLDAADARLALSGKRLFPYQRTGVRWLAPRKAALLADDMGLGKTAQALISLPEGGPTNIVCPGAVSLSWFREVQMWRPDLTPVLVKTSAQWRFARPGEVVISTYGTLPKADDEDVPPAPMGLTLVADEAHLLKGAKTARAKAWSRLRKNVKENGGRTWLLTGTPLINRPPELWAVLNAAGLGDEAFGSWKRFVSLFGGEKQRFGYEWGDASADVPLALQKVSLRRRKVDVLPDLPTKRRADFPVELPADAIRACDAVVSALREKGIDLDNLPKDFDLGSLISGPVFHLLSKARAQMATAKIPAALEIVESYEEAEEPLIVVSAHVEPVNVIGSRPGWAAITGETSIEDRGRIQQEFQAGKLKGVALTYKAGGVGITLTRSAYLLFVDLDWTPALIQQAEDRAVRIGQTRGVLITRLIAAHPLDARVCELLTYKQELIDSSVEAAAVGEDVIVDDVAAKLAEAATRAAASVADIPEPVKPEPKRNYKPEDLKISTDTFGNFRAPKDDAELRAGQGLLIVAAMDTDRAAVHNGVGFSKVDGEFGHSLANALRSYGRLSEKQWAAAKGLANRYRRQWEGGSIDTPVVAPDLAEAC